jgi:hypothetical protein
LWVQCAEQALSKTGTIVEWFKGFAETGAFWHVVLTLRTKINCQLALDLQNYLEPNLGLQ